MDTQTKATKIRELNDAFRRTLLGGRVMLTQGFTVLSPAMQGEIIKSVRMFNDFAKGNDPHGEHDFGSIELNGVKVFWKIDYYDPSLTGGSDDPTDTTKTTRILTIMLAEEY
jgi:Protein of unknown function (DUF3768)